jgi:hypothetical protein
MNWKSFGLYENSTKKYVKFIMLMWEISIHACIIYYYKKK